MKAIKQGHRYLLKILDGNGSASLQFVDRGHCNDTPGINNQEVLRVLIDRVEFLNKELPWEGNEKILQHLRMALVLHETRHLERLVERRLMHPENIPVGEDGHFLFEQAKSKE